MGHVSHNNIVPGTNEADMQVGVRAIVAHFGGVYVVADGKVTAIVPRPIAGLISDKCADNADIRADMLRITPLVADGPYFNPQPDRRFVPCGRVPLRTSGLRIVENFLDTAHFPFVHPDLLGAEPHTEAPDYRSEIRRDVDEVWATNCTFFQSRVAATESAGGFMHLTFRAPSPFAAMRYRVCPGAPDRLDAIALFIQPMAPMLCRAQPVMYLVDNQSPHQELLRFEQVIFTQDLLTVQDQRPLLMPLDAGSEIPARADSASVAYRRWLKEKGVTFGTTQGDAAARRPLRAEPLLSGAPPNSPRRASLRNC